jgi:hypothetical protein
MSTRESKKIIYKLASGTTDDQTLQEALTRALWKYKKPSSRVEPIRGDTGSEVRFVNVRRQHQGMLIGLFHKLTKGSSQLIIKMAESGQDDAWEVVPIKARGNPEDASEFIQGTLFFGVWKNHVILHQTSGCRADQFQDHATWLLAKLLEAEEEGPVTAPLICLADPIPPDLRRKSSTQARKIKFGSSIDSGLVPAAKSKGASDTVSKTKAIFTPTGAVWAALKLIFKSHNIPLPEEVLLDESITEDIRVYLELTTPKRKAEGSAGTVLGTLGRALSHSDIDYEVELVDGSKYGPKEMKVEKTIRVECVDRQPVVERMFASMVEWMTELVESKRVVEQEPFGNLK